MKNKTIRLTETAVMMALATVLSILPILELPYGGSVTLCSALPLLIIAYRYGTGWGIYAGIAYGVLQMFLGLKNVMYFTTPLSIAAVILLDYVFAFAALGLGGIFRKNNAKQSSAMVYGCLAACATRYILHTIAGCTVWAGLSIPSQAALVYSLAYNATYMIPETAVALLGTAMVCRVLDFRGDNIRHRVEANGKFNGRIAAVAIVIAAVCIYVVRTIFARLQNGETGEFMLEGLTQVPWGTVGIVSGAGAVIVAILLCARKKK